MSRNKGRQLREQLGHLNEEPSRRSVCGKHFKKGRNKYQAVFVDREIHYKNGADEWHEIDLEPKRHGGEVRVSHAPYIAKTVPGEVAVTFKKRGDGGLIKISLDKINDQPLTNVPAPTIRRGEKTIWRDVQPGLDITLEYSEQGVEFFKILKDAGAPRKLEWKYEPRGEWTGEIDKNTVGWDSGRNASGVPGRRNMELNLSEIDHGNGSFSLVEEWTGRIAERDAQRVKSWTSNVVYPAVIDASVVVTSGTTNNTGWSIYPWTNWYNYTIYFGESGSVRRAYGGVRFESVNIPGDATVNSAEMRLYAKSTNTAGLQMQFEIDDADDPPVWGTVDNPTALAGLAAGTFTVSVATANQYITGAIDATPVQSVIDRTGWSSGNAMRFALNPIATNLMGGIYFESETAARPRLTINYTEAASGEILVQRGIITYGASEDTDTATLGTAVSTSNAFARNTNTMRGGHARDSLTTGNLNVDDTGGNIELTATSTVTATRESAGENVDYRAAFEAWEFPSSGDNAAVVRYHDEVTLSGGTTDTHQAVSGITDIDDCIPIICGIRCNATGRTADRFNCTVEMDSSPSNGVRIKRGTGTDTVIVTIVCIEFTGANWVVENNVEKSSFTAAGANEAVSITSVTDIATACIFSSHRCSVGGLDETGYNCWFKDADEIYFRLRSGAGLTGQVVIAHVLKHADMVVDHRDSIVDTETEHGSGDQTVNVTVDTQDNLSTSGVLATADCSGTGTAYPRQFWNYRLTSTTNVEFYRGRTGQASDWALQVIDFSGITSGGGGDPDPVPQRSMTGVGT